MMTTYAAYEKTMFRSLWTWADRHHRGELDGGKRQGWPPVLAGRFALRGVLVPPSGTTANDIRTAVPKNQQHRWFRSIKSSQALTQSGASRRIGHAAEVQMQREHAGECDPDRGG